MSNDEEEIKSESLLSYIKKSLKRSYDMYIGNYMLPLTYNKQYDMNKYIKINDEYNMIKHDNEIINNKNKKILDLSVISAPMTTLPVTAPLDYNAPIVSSKLDISIKRPTSLPRPKWHPPWKITRVLAGHSGWVRCLAVDWTNEWFASGGQDRLIKIWDLATGTLKLTLTGHVSTVRGLAVSSRHPYLFSCAEDQQVKCWDLEVNKVVRHYHGHLSGVYCLSLHPSLDVLFTGGRDAVVRVWDIRTKQEVHCMSGHSGTVMSLVSQSEEPQVISGSMDKMSERYLSTPRGLILYLLEQILSRSGNCLQGSLKEILTVTGAF
eukprot:GHVL01020462.1.p1 GENE.GHVL01020462.1~~GHVL01020462.1.p1  ORF type:complete len:321 (+),score=59.73 GHVL01020462.1:34-996(+)